MNNYFDEKVLHQLGLSSSVTAVIEQLPVVKSTTQVSESALDNTRRLFLESRAAKEMGFRLATLETWPPTLTVEPPGNGFRVVTSSDFFSSVEILDEGEGDKFRFAVPGGRAPLAVVNRACEGLIFALQGEVLLVGQLVRLPKSFGLEAEVTSSIEDWLESMDDEWLCETVRQRLQIGGNWSHLVAVGLYYRLQNPWDRYATPDPVQVLLAGGDLPEDEVVLDWVKALNEDVVEQLAYTTLAVIERLRESLQEFTTLDATADQDIRSALYLRDDIESAEVLLHSRPSFARVKNPLAMTDKIGEILFADHGVEFDFGNDERLSRAARCTPEGWWTGNFESEVEDSASTQTAEIIRFPVPSEATPMAAASAETKPQPWQLDTSGVPCRLVKEGTGELHFELHLDGAEAEEFAIIAISTIDGQELAREELVAETHGSTTYVKLGASAGEHSQLHKLLHEAGQPIAELEIFLEVKRE